MYKLTLIAALILGLSGCDRDKILTTEVDVLVDNQVKSNAEILGQMNSFINKHGKAGFEHSYEIVKAFEKIHEDIKKFNANLDKLDRKSLPQTSNEFVRQVFDGLKLESPLALTFDENTPRSLIKLQIVNLENLYLRQRGGQVRFSFNNFELVVIPDKLSFDKNDKVTGKIFLAGYSDELRRPMKMNGKEIDVKGGKGLFVIDPKDIKDPRKHLKAEMIFPDTTFTTLLRLE